MPIGLFIAKIRNVQELNPICFELSNGMRVVYLYTPTYVAHIGLTFLAGSRYEEENEVGLAHFLEHCLFKGTTKRKPFHILSRLDTVGGELNAFTSKEELCIHASFTNEHTERTIELLADITMNSNFPIKEIDKEKEIILDELNSYLDSPSDKIFDDFEAQLFKNHPLGNNILGTKESVQSFTSEDLQRYVDRLLTAQNGVISFVGPIPQKKLQALLEKHFGNFRKGEKQQVKNPFSDFEPFKVWTQEANYQVHAIIGSIAPNYSDEERKGMNLLTNILGGPALNSRLTLSIREKYGYSYNVEANYNPYVETGFWSIYLGTDQKYLNKSLELVKKELKRMRDDKLTTLQLHQAKQQLKGHLALSLDSNSGLMIGLGKSLLLFNQIDTIQEIQEGIDKVTAEEILTIANKYLLPENYSEMVFEMK
jgi:predicted Zn-dependent peptidase